MSTIRELLESREVVVCVGSGGVGKTTTSALFALHAAIEGRKTLVMTIDPARRLANSLGVAGLDHDLQQVDLTQFEQFGVEPKGELWGTMLDMKSAFDAIVERHVETDEEREKIANNRFYKFFSTSLAGAQELSASERLLDVVESGEFDLVVLDTPPTTNALDFLEAPGRFFEALDQGTIRWFINLGTKAAKGGGGLMNLGTSLIAKTLGRFTGAEFFEELADFLYHLNSVLLGFHERSQVTQSLLSDERTAFVIVTTPDPATASEAGYFRERLDDFDVQLGGLVVNRVRRHFAADGLAEQGPGAVVDAINEIPGADRVDRHIIERLAKNLLSNADEFNELADRDIETVQKLRERLDSQSEVAQVPMYAMDIHSLLGLEMIRRDLFDLEQLPDEVIRSLARIDRND
jgi:anion-transporting  ArsA/GET3 family ATPase